MLKGKSGQQECVFENLLILQTNFIIILYPLLFIGAISTRITLHCRQTLVQSIQEYGSKDGAGDSQLLSETVNALL